jgi:hypothetical protein
MTDTNAHDGHAPSALPSSPRKPRAQAAEYLTAHGYPITKGRLAKLAMNGLGPEYRIWGNRAMYEMDKLIAWAKSLDRSPRRRAYHHDAT